MKCPHCGVRIQQRRDQWIRLCPYCKSILDANDFKFPTHNKKGIHVDLCVPNTALVMQRGKKTARDAKRPGFWRIAFPLTLVPILLLLLVGVFGFVYALTLSYNPIFIMVILILTGGIVFWIWLMNYSYRTSPLLEPKNGLDWQDTTYSPLKDTGHLIALYSNDESLVWYVASAKCNSGRVEDAKTAKNEVWKKDVLAYKFVDDKYGGMYVLCGANNVEFVKIPAVYTEEQIAELLPCVKKIVT